MNKIVDTPKPPYYAVIAPAELSEDIVGYPEMAQKLIEIAQDIPGFIGIESSYMRGFVLAVTYWESLEAIQNWRVNAHHMIAKQNAKTKWFKKYFTRIAKVEMAY